MVRKNLTTEQKKRNLWMVEDVDDWTRQFIINYAHDHSTNPRKKMKIHEALRQICVLAQLKMNGKN